MKDQSYMTLATIAGEIWGTQARAHMSHPATAATPRTILGYDVYFDIFNKLKEDFKKEVTLETEAVDGEDDKHRAV